MKILVTGGAGFVGLNLVEALLARGDAVVVAGEGELPAYARGAFEPLAGRLATARADVTDVAALEALFAEHAPDAVVHAAIITAGEQRELTDFDRIVDVNVKGAAHVLAAAAAHGARRMIYVSSGSAYGGALFDGNTVREETPPRPDTLYAITKYASERICARFAMLREIEVVCARLGSVFGPWERATGVRDTLSLPFQILRLARAGEEVILPQHEARRDWVYSRDVASGLTVLLEAAAPRHELYNLSSGRPPSAFAARWCAHLKTRFPALRYRYAHARETPNVSFLGDRDRAMMSIERIGTELGFQCAYDEPAAFSDYLAWLDANMAYYD